MYEQIGKSKGDEGKSMVNPVAQKKNSEGPCSAFIDNRPQNIIQKSRQSQNYVSSQPIQQESNKTGLPDNLKSGIENLSGYSLDDVTVHYNSDKPRQLQAHAYAQGTDIHLASGQERHLPHEAWHVVQQKQGRVKPTLQLKGAVPVNDDAGLEREADVMGAAAMRSVSTNPAQLMTVQAKAVVQREKENKKSDSELKHGLDQLKKLAAHEAKQASDPEILAQLKHLISQLDDIVSGDDEELKSSIAEALNGALNDSLAEALEGHEKSEDTVKDTSGGVVQGWWAIDYLLSAISSHPTVSIAAGLITVAGVIERVIARKKSKTLPSKISANLFQNNLQEYWDLVGRRISEFSRVNGLDAHDKRLIRQATVDALNASDTEVEFLGLHLFHELGNLLTAGTLNNPNANLILGAHGGNFVHALSHDIPATTARSIHTVKVPDNQRAGFSAALKQMPFVKKLYSGKVQRLAGGEYKHFKKEKGKGLWKGGGSISQNIQEVDDGYDYISKDRREIDNGHFRQKVKEAERIVKQMVEPAVLGQVSPPVIRVHLRNKMTPYRLWGFRAFEDDNGVNVAQDHDVHTIVHEIGHHIEDQLPMLAWSDIQLLLHGRNLDKTKAKYIYPHSYEEQRFSGDYPATGRYTSKYYEGGSTEVMSMSMEYLSHPTRFRTLIDRDPQQAAIILRVLRPTEFAATAALNAYHNYLPA